MVNMSRLSQYIATSILSRVSGPDSYVWLFLFPQLLQVRLVSKSQTMGTGVAVFFTQRKSFSHPEFQSRQQLQNTQRCRYWPKMGQFIFRLTVNKLGQGQTKISDVDELKRRIISEWAALSHTVIDSAVREWRQRLRTCVRAGGGHFEHMLK